MKKLSFLFITMLFLSNSAYAVRLYNEKYYQNEWCCRWNGRQEVKLSDKTRVDCITKNYAVEFDFAPKWAEALGQSLHYGKMTGKKPAIILIIESKKDFVYYDRLKPLCQEYGITLWYIKSPLYYSRF